jgi:signal transduction histidine kinase
VSGPGGAGLFLYENRFAARTRLVALALIVGTAFIGQPHPGTSGHGLVILISLAVAALTLAMLSTGASPPRELALAVMAALAAGTLAGYEPTVGTAILLLFVGLSAGASATFGTGAAVSALAVLTTTLSVVASGEGTGTISMGAIAVVGFLAASGRRQYALRAEEMELRLADAERARSEHARAAALAERATAAREIHDILAHSLGALVLQLDALGAVLDAPTTDRARSVELLGRARALAVDGLNETRQAVGTLRTDAPPLLDGLRQLVAHTPGATLEITGAPRAVAADVAVALRRTTQEGLANAHKHAPGSVIHVAIDFDDAEVTASVTDSGGVRGAVPGSVANTGGGYGLDGLRDRAELIGGTLSAGAEGTGWRVTLRAPVDPRRPDVATP